MDKMPAGNYYIGDLCYVMHDVWDEVCIITNDKDGGKFKLKDGREFAMFNTAYGDGTYNGISVDSGTIGCIKVEEILDNTYSVKQINSLAKFINFREEFEVFENNGDIFFGDMFIETGDDYFSEEDYDYFMDDE